MVKRNKILIASDHRGYQLKNQLLEQFTLLDLGCFSLDSVDYNDYATVLVKEMQEGDSGILICGTGLGMSMAANRHPGIRAALCYDEVMTRLAREHNDANLLVLPGFMSPELATRLTELFLNTDFSQEERHKRRIAKLC